VGGVSEFAVEHKALGKLARVEHKSLSGILPHRSIDCAVEIKTSYAYKKPDKRHKPNIMKSSITTQNPSIENINDCNKTADLVPCINDCTRMPNLLQPHIEPPSGQQHITTLPTTPTLDSVFPFQKFVEDNWIKIA